ncbi:MAG: hypothetical protein KAT43_00175 [Nanoarchaeota archaeon]|nr:hypothetical protein [Nanoarchaeota archaeon]
MENQEISHISVLSAPLLLLLILVPIVLLFFFKFASLPDMTNAIFFSILIIYPAVIAAFLGYSCARHHLSEKDSLKYEVLVGLLTGIITFVFFIYSAPQAVPNILLYLVISIVIPLLVAVFFTLLFRLFFHEHVLPSYQHKPLLNYKNPFDIMKFLRLSGDVHMVLFIALLTLIGAFAGAVYSSLIFIVGFLVFNYLIGISYKTKNEVLAILVFIGFFLLSLYLSYILLIFAGLVFLKAWIYFSKTDRKHNFFALYNCWMILLTYFVTLLVLILLFMSHVLLPFFKHMSVMYLIIIYFIILALTFPVIIRIGASLIGRTTGKINFFAAAYPLTLLLKPRRSITWDPIMYGIFISIFLMIIILIIAGISGTIFASNIYERALETKAELIEATEPLMIEEHMHKLTWKYPIVKGKLPSMFLSLQTQYESQLQSYKNYYIPRVTGFGAFFNFVSGKVFDDMAENTNRMIRLSLQTSMLRNQAKIAVDEFAAINANKVGKVDFLDRTKDLQEHIKKMQFASDQLYEQLSPTFGLEKQQDFVPFSQISFFSGTLFGKTLNEFIKHTNLALALTRVSNLNTKLKKEFGNEYYIEKFRIPSETLVLKNEALRLRLLLHYLGQEYLEGCESYDTDCYSKLTLFVTDFNVCSAADPPQRCEEAFQEAFEQYSRCPDNTLINNQIKKCS